MKHPMGWVGWTMPALVVSALRDSSGATSESQLRTVGSVTYTIDSGHGHAWSMSPPCQLAVLIKHREPPDDMYPQSSFLLDDSRRCSCCLQSSSLWLGNGSREGYGSSKQ